MRSPGDDPAGVPSGSPEVRSIDRLKRRADFVRAGKGQRWHGKALTLQVNERDPSGDAAPARVGFTLTKRVGCAVVRNRARRRLREAVRLSQLSVLPGHDYVIVGRLEAIRLPFDALCAELARAMRAVEDRRPRRAEDATASGGKDRARGGRNHDLGSPRSRSSRSPGPKKTAFEGTAFERTTPAP